MTRMRLVPVTLLLFRRHTRYSSPRQMSVYCADRRGTQSMNFDQALSERILTSMVCTLLPRFHCSSLQSNYCKDPLRLVNTYPLRIRCIVCYLDCSLSRSHTDCNSSFPSLLQRSQPHIANNLHCLAPGRSTQLDTACILHHQHHTVDHKSRPGSLRRTTPHCSRTSRGHNLYNFRLQ